MTDINTLSCKDPAVKLTKDILLSIVIEEKFHNIKKVSTKLNSQACYQLNKKFENDIVFEQKEIPLIHSKFQSGKTLINILKKPTLRNHNKFKTVKETINNTQIILKKIQTKNQISEKKNEFFKRKFITKHDPEDLNKSMCARDSIYTLDSIVENINTNRTFWDKKTLARIEEGYHKLKKLAESFKVLYKEEACLIQLKKLLTFKDLPLEETLEFDSGSHRSNLTSIDFINFRWNWEKGFSSFSFN
jgi:hypothetical protein